MSYSAINVSFISAAYNLCSCSSASDKTAEIRGLLKASAYGYVNLADRVNYLAGGGFVAVIYIGTEISYKTAALNLCRKVFYVNFAFNGNVFYCSLCRKAKKTDVFCANGYGHIFYRMILTVKASYISVGNISDRRPFLIVEVNICGKNGVCRCGLAELIQVRSSRREEEFHEKDGRKFVLQDLHEMNRLAREAYPGLPVILLGHSMGSFFARMYAVLYPETLHALVLSGTGGPNPLAGVGLALTEAIGRVKGRKHRSKFLNNMAFGQYLKRVDSPDTPYDWISRDKEVVARYAQDAKCTFIFTASAFHELMAILRAVNRPQWAQKVDKRLPVALFAGDADPVGDYGRGVESVYRALKDAGVKDVFLKLYPGARHEILNETNRAEVYADILAWCDAHQA